MNSQCLREWMAFGLPFSLDVHQDGPLFFHDYRFQYDGSSIDDAIVRIDNLLTEILLDIQGKYPSDTVFGLGLSGGLDSRVLLYYMLKVGMKVQTFIWGTPKPRRIFYSRDHRSSILISRKLGVPPPVFVPFTMLPDMALFHDECKNFPFLTYGFSHHVDWSRMPPCDVMIYGLGGGEIFGSCQPPGPCTDYTDYLIHRLSLLVGIQIKHTHKEILGVLPRVEYDRMYSKIKCFLDRYEDPRCGIQSFIYDKCDYTNKSVGGEKPFWDKRFVDESLQWDPDWLSNRYIYKMLYRSVFPFLGYIPGQRYLPPILSSGSLPRRLWYLGEYVLRWNGMNYQAILGSRVFHTWGDTILSVPNSVFSQFFDTGCVMGLPYHLGVLYATIVRMKLILDRGIIE